jgi:hypothetical protein
MSAERVTGRVCHASDSFVTVEAIETHTHSPVFIKHSPRLGRLAGHPILSFLPLWPQLIPSRDGLSPPTTVLTQSKTRRPSQTQRIASHTAKRVYPMTMVATPLVLPSKLLSLHLLVLSVQFIGAASVYRPPLPYRILAWLLRKRSYPTLRTMVRMRALPMTAVTAMATPTTPGKNHLPTPASPHHWASQIGSKSSEKLMTNTMPMSARKVHIKYGEPYPTPKKRPMRIPLAAR